ncbi:schwannomin-interacting protein 1-like isoform X2 [Rhinoraja longicauda]
MDWEALEQHIEGLQRQETERRAREGPRPQPPHPPASPVGRRRAEGMQRLVSWPRADSTAWRAMGETMGCASRFHNRMNLQLCFINDSSSESDPEDEGQRSPADPPPQGPGVGVERALEHGDLLDMSLVHVQQLQVNILSQIHHFNGQLMELLESRDDLRTEQDAMLVEIGDLTH